MASISPITFKRAAAMSGRRISRRVLATKSRTFVTTSRANESASEKPPQASTPHIETFSAPSKPREYYARPQRDLPPLQRKWPVLLAASIIGVSTWAAFYLYAANQERLSSSVVRQVMNTVSENAALQEALGDAIRFEPVWWLNGDPYIKGGVHLLQGNVDLCFRIKGHKGAGTLYFTSIRKAKGEPFTILRFRVICDNGAVIEVPASSVHS